MSIELVLIISMFSLPYTTLFSKIERAPITAIFIALMLHVSVLMAIYKPSLSNLDH